ncbi:MAG: FliH/SctL family protein [Polyangiaceae bacterium]
MTIGRGRVLKAGAEGWQALPTAPPAARAQGRRVPKEIVEAELRAKQIVQAAEAQAKATLEAARQEVAGVKLRAQAEGRAEAAAALAARAVELKVLEGRADERALDRLVQVATVLAERLLGERLVADPTRVTALARQALQEARGARAIKIHAHPEDAAVLRADLHRLGVDPSAVTFVEAPSRVRGHLLLETDIGVLDAELGPQLQRLGQRIRESLGP